MTLIASELVTNAVLYSGCTEEDEIQLRLERTGGHLRLSVLDSGRTAQARESPLRSSARVGWGCFVVEQLASRWGAERSERHCVWVEIPLSDSTSLTSRELPAHPSDHLAS